MNKLVTPDGVQVDSFRFDEEAGTIEVVKRVASKMVYASNPPQSAPDKVWKEIYGIKDGKLAMLKTIEGKHIPRSINHEQIIFEEQTA
jgi:hypothetical protein